MSGFTKEEQMALDHYSAKSKQIRNLRAYIEGEANQGNLKPMKVFLRRSWMDYLKVLENSPPIPHAENTYHMLRLRKYSEVTEATNG